MLLFLEGDLDEGLHEQGEKHEANVTFPQMIAYYVTKEW